MNQREINEIFPAFNNLKALIIGDVMIDSYIKGVVNRISPEAPVPVISVNEREKRLGGAANVAINIKALDANPILCSVISNDSFGDEYISLMQEEKLSIKGILRSSERKTTVKTRLISASHQLLRVDEETIKYLSKNEESAFIERVSSIINTEEIDVIIFQDYDKGIITENIINKISSLARENNIPIAVDPKRNNFLNFIDVDLFKPNLKELAEGLNITFDNINETEISQASKMLKDIINNRISLITLSQYGIYIESEKESRIFSAHLRNISDVSGAGDTVISVASLCLALNASDELIAKLSNLAGGLVCESVGVVPIDKERLMQEAILVSK